MGGIFDDDLALIAAELGISIEAAEWIVAQAEADGEHGDEIVTV